MMLNKGLPPPPPPPSSSHYAHEYPPRAGEYPTYSSTSSLQHYHNPPQHHVSHYRDVRSMQQQQLHQQHQQQQQQQQYQPMDDYPHHPYNHTHHQLGPSLRQRYSHHPLNRENLTPPPYPEPPLVLADVHLSTELRNGEYHQHQLHHRNKYASYPTSHPIRSYPPKGEALDRDDNNIAIVQPSFDEQDTMVIMSKGTKTPSPKRTKKPRSSDRKVIVTDEISDKRSSTPSSSSSPSLRLQVATAAQHKRDLSAQFYDEAIYHNDNHDEAFAEVEYSAVKDNSFPPSTEDSRQHKHLRSFSRDGLEDLLSHRRIHSITDSPTLISVTNKPPSARHNSHIRHDSAGLDILSAAIADATEQEMLKGTNDIHERQGGEMKHNPSSFDNPMRQVPWDPTVPVREQAPYPSIHPFSRSQHPPLGAAEHPHMHPPVPRSGSASMGPPPLPILPYPAPHQRQFRNLPPRHPPPPYHHPSDPMPSYQHGYYNHPHHPSVPPPPPPPPPHSYFHGNYPVRSHIPLYQMQEPNATTARVKSPILSNVGNRKPDDASIHRNGRVLQGDRSEHPLSSANAAAHPKPVTSISDGKSMDTKRPRKRKAVENESTSSTENVLTTDRAGGTRRGGGPLNNKTTKQHHRKLSSFSCVGGNIFGFSTEYLENNMPTSLTKEQHPLKASLPPAHHRSTSSSVAFTKVLDSIVSQENDVFLRNLQKASLPEERSPIATRKDDERPIPSSIPVSGLNMPTLEASNDSDDDYHVVTIGGTSKRVRRKCTVGGCRNRVVQGGLCITHGAKRKTCLHPGCTKKVKKAGLCSSHGPARKRCEALGCDKVAVQRGKCIAHGAKKKLCKFDECPKQAILRGMCKKHHDLQKATTMDPNNKDSNLSAGEDFIRRTTTMSIPSSEYCVEVNSSSTTAVRKKKERKPKKGSPSSSSAKKGQQQRKRKQQQEQRRHKPTHTRGLSIFHDISADTVSSILNDDENNNGGGTNRH